MTLFSTPRLRVRLLARADFQNNYRLLSDPETMRYVRAPFTEEAQLEERMATWLGYAEKRPGLGSFVLEEIDSGVFAGICVARQVDYNPEHEEYEIGYILAPEFWGQGLASELVPYLSAYCFSKCNAPYLVAFTDPDNAASQRVLTKSGFEYKGLREGQQEMSSSEFRLPRLK